MASAPSSESLSATRPRREAWSMGADDTDPAPRPAGDGTGGPRAAEPPHRRPLPPSRRPEPVRQDYAELLVGRLAEREGVALEGEVGARPVDRSQREVPGEVV